MIDRTGRHQSREEIARRLSGARSAGPPPPRAARYVEEVTDPTTGERLRFEAETAADLEAAVEEWLASSAAP